MVKVQTNSQGKVYTSNGKALLSSSSSGKYQLLERIKDDNDTEIGTVSGFFTDSNNIEYAVVCLDAQYRSSSGVWCSNASIAVTDLPIGLDSGFWELKNTATFNTQKIIDFCNANSYTSTACSHCRSKSFTINNTVYYGQLPNAMEIVDIYKNRTNINNKDSSASTYSAQILGVNIYLWCSTQRSESQSFRMTVNGYINGTTKTTSNFICPVLEIPNQ